jgi:hypothetical protein
MSVTERAGQYHPPKEGRWLPDVDAGSTYKIRPRIMSYPRHVAGSTARTPSPSCGALGFARPPGRPPAPKMLSRPVALSSDAAHFVSQFGQVINKALMRLEAYSHDTYHPSSLREFARSMGNRIRSVLGTIPA